MVNLSDAIARIRPGAVCGINYVVSGGEIVRWDEALGPVPDVNSDELAAAGLAAYRQARLDAIDARSVALIGRGFPFDGQLFSLSANAQLNWTGLYAGRALVQFPKSVPCVGGSYLIVSAEALDAFYGSGLVVVDSIISAGTVLKEAIGGAADVVAIDLVVDTR